MTSARRPCDGEIIPETMAGAEAARAPNFTDDKEEQAAHGNRNRSKEEEEDARKKEEAEAALALFLECWLRHWNEEVARKKEEEENARKKEEEEAAATWTSGNKCLEGLNKLLESVNKDLQKWEVKTKEEVNKRREWLMLLATIAVTISYASGLNPPGGMWQDDSPGAGGHTAGTPVLQTNAPSRYLTFYYTNAMSFVTSLLIVALLLDQKPRVKTLTFATLFDLTCLVVAYLAGTTNGVLLSIPLILVALLAFAYVAYGLLVFLLLFSVLTALMWCLSLLCVLPCIAIWFWDVATESEQNDDRHQKVDV